MEDIKIYFVDNRGKRRSTLLEVVEKLKENKKYNFRSAFRRLKETQDIYPLNEMVAALKDSAPALWILDVSMADFSPLASALNEHPDFKEHRMEGLGKEQIDFHLFIWLHQYLEANNKPYCYITSKDSSYLQKTVSLMPNKGKVEFPDGPENHLDIQAFADFLIAEAGKIFSSRDIGIIEKAKQMLAYTIAHVKENHVKVNPAKGDQPFNIAQGVAEYLGMESWQQLCQELNLYQHPEKGTGFKQPANFMEETLKGLSEKKLSLGGILLLAWGVVRHYPSLKGNDEVDEAIKGSIQKAISDWSGKAKSEREQTLLLSFCRNKSFHSLQQSTEWFTTTAAHLVGFFNEVFKPQGPLDDSSELQLVGVDCDIIRGQLRFDLKVSPRLIAALNGAQKKIYAQVFEQRNNYQLGSCSEKFVRWATARLASDDKSEGLLNDGSRHAGYNLGHFGSDGHFSFLPSGEETIELNFKI